MCRIAFFVAQNPRPEVVLPDGSSRCTNWLNLGPVSGHCGGKVVARVGGICELMTPSRHGPV
jgi:hypothetical protein